MFLNTCVTSAYVSTFAPSGTPSSARQSRFIVPPPPGTRPTPTSTRPGVRLRRGLHRRRAPRQSSSPPPSVIPYGAATTGTRRVLHPLAGASGSPSPSCGSASHSFCCAAITTRNRFAPTQKCSPWLATTSARKSFSAFATASVDHLDDVGVDAVRLRLEGEPEHAVAEVPRLGAVVLEHRARCPCAATVSVAVRGSTSRFDVLRPSSEVEDPRRRPCRSSSRPPRSSCRSTRGAATPSFFMRSTTVSRSRARPTSRTGPSSQL